MRACGPLACAMKARRHASEALVKCALAEGLHFARKGGWGTATTRAFSSSKKSFISGSLARALTFSRISGFCTCEFAGDMRSAAARPDHGVGEVESRGIVSASPS